MPMSRAWRILAGVPHPHTTRTPPYPGRIEGPTGPGGSSQIITPPDAGAPPTPPGGGTAVFEAQATAELNGTALAVTIPAAASVGSFAIATVSHGVTGITWTPPAGWVLLTGGVGGKSSSQSTTSQSSAVYTKTIAAGEPGSSVTFTSSATGKQAVSMVVYSACSGIYGWDVATYTTADTVRLSPALAHGNLRSLEVAATKGTAPVSSSPPGTHTARSAITQLGTGSVAIDVADSTSDLNGGNTWTHNASTNQATVYIFDLNSSGAGGGAGTVQEKWPASWTSTTFRVRTRLTGATSVRLAYSLTANMASPSYVAAQVPDGDGYVTHVATGLTPETRYYFQLQDTPSGGAETAVGTVGTIVTMQTVGTAFATPLKIVMGGCNATADATSTAYVNALNWGFHMGLHNGDFTYSGTESTAEADHRAKITDQLAAVPNLKEFVGQGGASMYVRSDHDCGVADNGDSNNAWTAANIVAYKKYFPVETLNDPGGTTTALDQIRNTGRVSFFQIDNRNTNRSPGANTDNSSKTLLGAAQKARLIDWLQNNPAKFKVILGDTQWMGVADAAKPDWWPSYITERTELAGHIATAQAAGAHVEYWHGDAHLIGYATAAKNPDGFPVLCAAPYANTGGGRQTGTFSAFYNDFPNTVNLYGRITISDSGTAITRTFSGWDSIAGVERVSDTVVHNTAPVYTGTLAASTPKVTGSSAGTTTAPVYTGTVATATPLTTGSAAGVATAPTYTGTLAASTPRATTSITGTVTGPVYTGTLAATLPLASASVPGNAAGPVYTATLSGSLPRVTASSAGTSAGPVYTGTLAPSTPLVTVSMAGTSAGPVFTGTLAASAPIVTGSVAGTVTAPVYAGTVAASAPPVTSNVTGTVTAPAGAATLSTSVPLVTSIMAGTTTAPVYTGTVSAATPLVSGSMAGVTAGPQVGGVLTVSLPPTRTSITGTVTAPTQAGSLLVSVPLVAGSLVGTVTAPSVSGALAAALPLTQATIAGWISSGPLVDVTATFGSFTGHPLGVGRLAGHPLNVAEPRGNPLTAGELVGHPTTVGPPQPHPLTVGPPRS